MTPNKPLKTATIQKKENFLPIVKLEKLNLGDSLLKGVINDETLILQEKEENFSPIVKLEKLNWNDLFLKGVISYETLILQEKKENFSPIVQLEKLNLNDLKGVKIINDETLILQESYFVEEDSQFEDSDIEERRPKRKNKVSGHKIEGRRTRPKIAKKYFVEEESEFEDSISPEEDFEERRPKRKNKVSGHKRDLVEKDSEFEVSSSPEEESDFEKRRPKRKSNVSGHKKRYFVEKKSEYEDSNSPEEDFKVRRPKRKNKVSGHKRDLVEEESKFEVSCSREKDSDFKERRPKRKSNVSGYKRYFEEESEFEDSNSPIENFEERRPKHKSNISGYKRYFAGEESEFEDSNSPIENFEERRPKRKSNVSGYKRYFVEEEFECEDSDSPKEDFKERRLKRKNKVSGRKRDLVEEESKFEVSCSREEGSDFEERIPKHKSKVSEHKGYFVEEESESDVSGSLKENSDFEERKPQHKNKVSELQMEGRRTRPKIAKKYFVEEVSEIDDSNSPEEDSDFEESKPKRKKKVSDLKPKKLSSYEMLAQKNKEEKLAFLESLKIDEIQVSFAEAVEGLQTKRKKWEKRSYTPRINQQRSAKVKIDLSEEALEIKAMTSDEPLMAAEKLPQVLEFKDALEIKELYEDFMKNFNDLKNYSAEPFKNYDSHFCRMQPLKNPVILFEGKPVSCLSFHPMREKIIIASSSRHGKIGLLNVDSDSDLYVFKAHSECITHLKFNHEHPNTIVSSSLDGTLRCGDLEKRVFNEVYNVSENTCCTYFDFTSSDTCLVAQRNGDVSVVDLRTNHKTSNKTHHCHDASIKSVSVHPQQKNYFISADYEGFIKLWDLRKLMKEPISKIRDKNTGVMSALFSPLTGKHILSSNSKAVWNMNVQECHLKSFKLGRM